MAVAFLVEEEVLLFQVAGMAYAKAQSWGAAGLIRMGASSTRAMGSSGGRWEMRRPGRMGLSTGLRA